MLICALAGSFFVAALGIPAVAQTAPAESAKKPESAAQAEPKEASSPSRTGQSIPSDQVGRVTFVETAHNFGVIQEGVQATHRFVFRNAGDAPVRLTNVRPSCGCTTPSWTQHAIAPGDTGSVTTVYDSEGRPGAFDKTVAVHSDGVPSFVELRISGDVSPVRLAGVQQGNLILAADAVKFPRLQVGPPAVTTLRIQNAGDAAILIRSVETSAPALFSDYAERTVHPGQSDEITLILDTDNLVSGEVVAYELTLQTDDAAQPEKSVQIRGQVE